MLRFFTTHDLLLCPTVMSPPFDVDIRYLEEVEGVKFDNYVDWLMHTFVLTLTGCPAISVPCGLTEEGLPVGLQIVGPPRGEHRVLSAAHAFDQLTGLAAKVPLDPVRRH
jgi:amidase